jgi:hypothetical protein
MPMSRRQTNRQRRYYNQLRRYLKLTYRGIDLYDVALRTTTRQVGMSPYDAVHERRARRKRSPSIHLRLRWLIPDEGGRAQFPIGPEYRGVAMTEGAEQGWSIRLIFVGGISRAEAQFLIPEAAAALGAKFWLVEGRKRVAEAEVLSYSA